MKTYPIIAIALAAMLLLPTAAFAYVGPGAGISLIGAFWALIVALFTAFAFLLAWPMRRMLRQARHRRTQGRTQAEKRAHTYDREAGSGRTS